MATSVQERRRFIRHPATIPIQCRRAGHEAPHMGETQNISYGGIAFVSDEQYHPGDLVDVTFSSIPDSPTVRGKIVWCRPRESGKRPRFEDGLQFQDAETHFRARLFEQISRIESYQAAQHRMGRGIGPQEAAREWIDKYAGTFRG